MTHAPVCEYALATAGIGQNLIRLSVGLERETDLVNDVIAALEAARRATQDSPVSLVMSSGSAGGNGLAGVGLGSRSRINSISSSVTSWK